MIERITSIKNLAVFKNFDWNTAVVDAESNVFDFKKVNIIYGRNYSGKTTLSRVVRALETGGISDKYENPELNIKVKDNADVTHSDFSSHDKTIRVFNEDFIKDNLKFIVNPDESIQPFAILGGDNNIIEQEINDLKDKLGSNEEGGETKLYQELKSLNDLCQGAKTNHKTATDTLNNQIKTKALDRQSGIKYKSEKFGDQNYSVRKLEKEIQLVLKDDFKPLTDTEKKETEEILTEKKKDPIKGLPQLQLNFKAYSDLTKEIVTRKIGKSDKIEELVKNAVLNRWVSEGKKLHQAERKICAFCNNEITAERWSELDRHFDEESNILEKDINNLLSKLTSEKQQISSASGLKKDDFYIEFHKDLEQLSEEYKTTKEDYISSIDLLEEQLNNRKSDLLNEKIFDEVKNHIEDLEKLRTSFDELRKKSDDYSDQLATKQEDAKKNLRLKEVYDFVLNINYNDQISNIATLKTKEETEENKKKSKQSEIDDILAQITEKQKELKDESKGADKVNEYLNDFFGHDFLTLKAVEYNDSESGDKKYRFEIHREDKKAHHLSEGECSLIAFCYFMAKLQDVDTKTKKPIIWIDDPISSLDSNHIFFIYTLINTQIFGEEDFEQLFISTHNLEFLKFLKRLPGAETKKETKTKYRYLLVERIDNESTLKLMPEFLREYVTEFNYLFSQIYKCSQIDNVTDSNYTVFYNFGNNARKFLEIFLYYKYPDSSGQSDKMKTFFGDENIPAVLTDRINNEYSHLSGVFERGGTVVEVPEMKKAAEKIINSLKSDRKQYEALLRSIGKTEEADDFAQQSTNGDSAVVNTITNHEKELVKVFNGNRVILELKNVVGVRNHKIFQNEYLTPAIGNGLVKETRKRGKKKQYCLTDAGTELKNRLNHEEGL
ncbi:AAA family ATPase [Carboxylicivirga sediminis]|uniref:AAA family ATPase n=1 Tax=Carboxylicivirga sediminis TaxID=2006564 RepID=A0A941F2W4_9BACT|nr:AAA family ATPase [Carboxylicivirga sediminis]MBR8535118.1 AAA family ATPase [Carboxylicivirga sediminis]